MSEWWEKYQGLVANAGIFYPEESWLDIKSVNDYKLHSYRFDNPDPIGILCIFHGMYCESNEATHVAKRFFENGFTVIAMDQEGHGKSEGPRGTILSLENFTNDSEKFLVLAMTRYPKDTPIFLMGQSMGGALCVMLSLLRPDLISGMLLFAPALGVSPDFEPTLQKIVRCLNCCCGCLRLKDFDQSLSVRSKDYIKYFKENPDNFNGKMNVRTAVAMLDGLENLHLQIDKVRTPVIAFQGGNDKIVSADETKSFIKNCKSSDKELVMIEEMYHDALHEPEIEELIEKSLDWIKERLNNKRDSNEIL